MMMSMLKVLEGFHHQVARIIMRMSTWRTTSGEWEGPPVAEALESTGLWTIKEYI